MPLVIFGLLVSIPIIVWGSQLVIKLMDRFPIIITLGGMLLGWIAGTMAVTDPARGQSRHGPGCRSCRRPTRCATLPASAARCWCCAIGKWDGGACRRAPRRPGGGASTGHAWPVQTRAARCRRVRRRAAVGTPPGRHARRPARSGGARSAPDQRAAAGVGRRVVVRVGASSLDEYYQERSEAALAPAREWLAAQGLTAGRAPTRRGARPDDRAHGPGALVRPDRASGSRGLGRQHLGSWSARWRWAPSSTRRVPVLLVK